MSSQVSYTLGRHGVEAVVRGRDPARGRAVLGAITAEGGKARFASPVTGKPYPKAVT